MRIERIQGEIWRPGGTAAQSNENAEVQQAAATVEKGAMNNPNDRRIADKTTSDLRERKVTEKDIEKLNKTAEAFNKKIHLKIHEETGRVMVKIVNGATEEVLLELPPEKILDLVAKIEEEMGLILDKRV